MESQEIRPRANSFLADPIMHGSSFTEAGVSKSARDRVTLTIGTEPLLFCRNVKNFDGFPMHDDFLGHSRRSETVSSMLHSVMVLMVGCVQSAQTHHPGASWNRRRCGSRLMILFPMKMVRFRRLNSPYHAGADSCWIGSALRCMEIEPKRPAFVPSFRAWLYLPAHQCHPPATQRICYPLLF